MLRDGKKSAGEIAEKFNLTGATVSYHLAKLKNADLIEEEKYKNFVYSRAKSFFIVVLTHPLPPSSSLQVPTIVTLV